MTKRVSKTDLEALQREWYGPGGKLEQSGFNDMEAYRPDLHGDKQPLLGKGERFVSIHAMLPSDDDALPADLDLFAYPHSRQYEAFDRAQALALRGILTRYDWEAVTAMALFCEGTSEREVSEIIGRSRNKTRKLLREFKEALTSRESSL